MYWLAPSFALGLVYTVCDGPATDSIDELQIGQSAWCRLGVYDVEEIASVEVSSPSRDALD